MERAASNALAAARFLADRPEVERVIYPGLPDHPDHALAEQLLGGRFGSIVAFNLRGDTATATRFIAAAKNIPFCPSLGELSTTLTHPESTSHRGMSPADRRLLGILGGTIRLSVGIESPQFVLSAASPKGSRTFAPRVMPQQFRPGRNLSKRYDNIRLRDRRWRRFRPFPKSHREPFERCLWRKKKKKKRWKLMEP